MIIDQSRRLRGISISRLSEYLSLCKVDCLVRNVANATPSRHVDQPSKVGQAGTMSLPVKPARPRYTLKVDYNLRMGNRDQTLSIKSEMLKQLRISIDSLSEVGTVILQQDGRDIERMSLYSAIACADNFAKTKRKEWRFCLVFEKQEQWVNAFLDLSGSTRLQSDYLMVIRQGQIWNYQVPRKVKEVVNYEIN